MKIYFFAFLMLSWPVLGQQSVPPIAFTSVPNYPNLPAGMNFGEVAGVAVNSKGHVFVFSRSNSATWRGSILNVPPVSALIACCSGIVEVVGLQAFWLFAVE